jgi:hypothetical protein
MNRLNGLLVLTALAVGCAAEKSENPLSPTVAGPIPGVEISAPRTLEPGGGQLIAADRQPVTLLLENASSNGPRPLTYIFEVATDAGFNSRVFTRDAIAPGDGGRTAARATTGGRRLKTAPTPAPIRRRRRSTSSRRW